MKREIKFRIWERNKMIYIDDFYWFEENYYHEVETDGRPLMQYTGLRDKNDIKIYEGDILRPTNPNQETMNPFTVEWKKNASTYPFEDDFDSYNFTSLGWAIEMEYSFEIIGNIHENPELIK